MNSTCDDDLVRFHNLTNEGAAALQPHPTGQLNTDANSPWVRLTCTKKKILVSCLQNRTEQSPTNRKVRLMSSPHYTDHKSALNVPFLKRKNSQKIQKSLEASLEALKDVSLLWSSAP